MRKKIRRKKTLLLNEGLKWWLPYLGLIEYAYKQGYRLGHRRYSRRYRWFVDRLVTTHFSMDSTGITTKHVTERIFTSGSMSSCINTLKLVSDWRGHGGQD